MNKEWQEFLTGAGAVVSNNGLLQFSGDGNVAPQNALCTLSDQAILRVSGDDAETFLQGQFSNDIAMLGTPGSQLSTWSSPKGRVLTLFRITRDAEGYLIQMPAELVESVVKRLRMFVMRAQVVIEPQADLVCLGVSGEAAALLAAELSIELPDTVDATVQTEDSNVVRVRGEQNRLEITTTVARARGLWEKLSAACLPCGDAPWKLQNIDAGVPSVSLANSEAFVLQMLNLQHINGVSFKKGCFPGQEVVARMQYLGKLKRRMYRLQGTLTDDMTPPAAGAELYNKDASSASGKVVDAQVAGDGTFRLLAVVAIAAAEQPLFLDKDAQQAVELLDLPYTVETEACSPKT